MIGRPHASYRSGVPERRIGPDGDADGSRGITRGRVTMPRPKFGTARLTVLRSRYSPPERSEGPSRPRERFSRIASRPPAAHPPPRKLRAVPPSPHDQWNLGRCHFGDGADGSASTIHPVSRHVRPRRRIAGTRWKANLQVPQRELLVQRTSHGHNFTTNSRV